MWFFSRRFTFYLQEWLTEIALYWALSLSLCYQTLKYSYWCVMLLVSNVGSLCTFYSKIFGKLQHSLKKIFFKNYYYYYYIILKNIPIVLLPKSNRVTSVSMFGFRLWEVTVSSLGGLQLSWLRFCRLNHMSWWMLRMSTHGFHCNIH